jgi:hypothetical protein
MNPKYSVIHFAWPIGNAESKIQRMKQYLQNYFENLDWIQPSKETTYYGRKYSWNGGFIQFLNHGILKTTWASGT